MKNRIKAPLVLSLWCISFLSFSQNTEELADTSINGNVFKKYNLIKFKDYSKDKVSEFYYESFNNNRYIRLDSSLKTVHNIVFNSQTEQNGILFYKQTKLAIKAIDTRSYFPRDSLVPDKTTPRKFYSISNPDNYLIARPDLRVIELSGRGSKVAKSWSNNNLFLIKLLSNERGVVHRCISTINVWKTEDCCLQNS